MRSDALRRDHLDLVADVYISDRNLSAAVARQIHERLLDHSLLAKTPGTADTLTFDHDDFQRFFLGRAIGQLLCEADDQELFTTLNLGSIPREAADGACRFVLKNASARRRVLSRLVGLGGEAPSTSYVKENCGSLALRLIGSGESDGLMLKGLVFPPDGLLGAHWRGVRVVECEFQPSSLKGARIVDCEFDGCRFHRLESGAIVVENVVCRDCEWDQWVGEDEANVYNPPAVRRALRAEGFTIVSSERMQQDEAAPSEERDPAAEMAERALRDIHEGDTHQ